MASIKRGAMVASTLILIALIVSACNQPYSQQPTSTPNNSPSLFESPIAQTPNITMSDVANFGTSTALALQTGTPLTGLSTQAPTTPISGTQDLFVTVTPTPLLSLPTSTLALGQTPAGQTPVGPLPTSAPVGSRPPSYTLQRGEFPYCIARRYDVNPQELLSLNGLTTAEAYSLATGTVLRIPQTGSFPPPRALAPHPVTHTVASGETIYSIACKFGDVSPDAIITANNLSANPTLTSGQTLQIP